MMRAKANSALVRPLDTKAIITAKAPAVTAPMIGMKLAKNVTTAMTSASGTCSAHRPRPMRIASTMATAAWAWMKPDKVFQMREPSSVTCQPVELPVYLRSQGKNLSPSLMMKKVTKSMISAATTMELAIEKPEITPVAMVEAWPLANLTTSWSTDCSWSLWISMGTFPPSP